MTVSRRKMKWLNAQGTRRGWGIVNANGIKRNMTFLHKIFLFCLASKNDCLWQLQPDAWQCSWSAKNSWLKPNCTFEYPKLNSLYENIGETISQFNAKWNILPGPDCFKKFCKTSKTFSQWVRKIHGNLSFEVKICYFCPDNCASKHGLPRSYQLHLFRMNKSRRTVE